MADDRSRLEKLIGMLGSEHDGEVVNAARMIKRMADKDGKTLAGLIMQGPTQTVYVDKIVYRDAPPHRPQPGGAADRAWERSRESFDEAQQARWQQARQQEREEARRNATGLYARIVSVLAHPHLLAHLKAWEQEFVIDMGERYTHDHEMTWKQREMIRKCLARIDRAEKRKHAEPLI